MNDNTLTNYSVIITYHNGRNRGYTIQASNQKEAFGKLMSHVDFDMVQRVEIAEIIINDDIIK